jgi:ABC-type hemin transport system substrate-binding protein
LAAVTRAIVVVRGWHTESFGPALLENSPEMFRFVEPAVFEQAARAFSPDAAPLKILVVPALAQTAAARAQSIQVLRAKGVDAAIPFGTMLADLIAQTEVNRNYDKSDLLQIIRVLKNYEFFKEPQMELFRPGRRSKRRAKE